MIKELYNQAKVWWHSGGFIFNLLDFLQYKDHFRSIFCGLFKGIHQLVAGRYYSYI